MEEEKERRGGLLAAGVALRFVYPAAFHGVCGLSRLSKRSVVATMTFMATGAMTVFVARHLLGIGP